MDLTPFTLTTFLICLTRRSERPKAFATCFTVHCPFIHASIKVALLISFFLVLQIGMLRRFPLLQGGQSMGLQDKVIP